MTGGNSGFGGSGGGAGAKVNGVVCEGIIRGGNDCVDETPDGAIA